jgi:hypothetical protein
VFANQVDLVATAAARPSGIASTGLCLIAGLAEDRAIASRLEGDRGLLAASGADNRCTLRCVGSIAAATPAAVAPAPAALMVILFCLTAGLAPLRCGVAPLAEKCLISSGKCEFLSTVAAGELQVPSHMKLLSYIRSRLESSCACFTYLLGTLEEIVRKSEQRFGS